MSEFERHQLEEILQLIAKHLTENVSIFLFGGAVMVYNNLKPSTKDIDILFEKEEDFEKFIKASKKAGFLTAHVPIEYEHFDMATMLKKPQNRLEIRFIRKESVPEILF